MQKCISSVCATILSVLGIDAPEGIDAPNDALTSLCPGADKVVIYNPDAVAWWIFKKYNDYFKQATELSGKCAKLRSVMPSVTPVCFASMYTGLTPDEHGIKKYEKPVLKVDTLFDYLVKAGKKVAIVSTAGDSISKIFLERKIDYYIYPSLRKVNRKAKELIKSKSVDVIIIYNGNYDSTMHKTGPESKQALRALKKNLCAYADFVKLIKKTYTNEKVFYGFCPDHGCHEIDGGRGSHGLDMQEDMNVVHLYGVSGEK